MTFDAAYIGIPEVVALMIATIMVLIVSFVYIIVAKEQTLSNFRQQWINALRDDIAALAANLTGIHGYTTDSPQKTLWGKQEDSTDLTEVIAKITGIHADSITPPHQEPRQKVMEGLTDLNELIAKIRLRLNSNENGKVEGPATEKVLLALEELESIFRSQSPQFHRLEPIQKALVSNTQIILKTNWERIKSGESIYKITKITFAMCIVATLVVGSGLLIMHFSDVLRYLRFPVRPPNPMHVPFPT